MPKIGYSKYQKAISFFVDLIILIVAFNLGYYLRQNSFFNFSDNNYMIILMVYVFAWWIIINQQNLILLKRGITIDKIILMLLKNIIFHLIVVYLVMIILRFYGISRLMLFYSFIIEIFLLIIWRIVYFKLISKYRRAGFNYRNIVIVGMYNDAKQLLNILQNQTDFGYKIKSIISNSEKDKIKDISNYSINDYKTILSEDIDEVFFTLNNEMIDIIPEIIQYCEQYGLRIKLFPNFHRFIKKRVTIDFLQDTLILLLHTEPLESLFARTLKRIFDIIFSLIIIISILSWLVPIMAILIKIESKGPIFFGQERTGKDNKIFKMLKFRSMVINQDSDNTQAKKGDSRVTKMGVFMRKTSIDELPQFFNVLGGSMSVVGPRPHMLQHTKEYTKIINQYMVRHFVKPGITGWAQINGFRGPTPEPELMRKRIEHDIWYLENWTFILDLIIIFRTVINIFKGEKNAI